MEICLVEEDKHTDTMTELYQMGMRAPHPETMEPTTHLDKLEDQTLTRRWE